MFFAEVMIEKREHLANSAQLAADNIARYAYLYGRLWRYQSPRLLELLRVNPVTSEPSRPTVADAGGQVIVETDETPRWPVLTASARIVIPGDDGGEVRVETSDDEIALALEPFRQVDNSLSLTSIKGEGTVAVVWLPDAAPDAIAEQPAAA